MKIKSETEERAEIYKALLSNKGFVNPMTDYILSFKHSLTILYQYLDDVTLKEQIESIIDTVEEFKNHTDNLSGLNLKSNKKIYEILDVIEHLKPFNSAYVNYYKLCLGSILNNDKLKKSILDINYFISSIVISKEKIDSKKIQLKLNKINNIIKEQIFSDNLAFENIKLELSTRSLSCSLSSMIHKTKQNIMLSDLKECPTFNTLITS